MIGRQYYLNHIGDIYGAWSKAKGRGVTIAVIDMAFKVDHPEFINKDGTSKVSPDSAIFKTTGYGSSAQTTYQVGPDKLTVTGESHGTFGAGVAAAAANGVGTVGIAPEANLLLLETDCKPKSIAKAFDYAREHGAKVITISIGSYYNYDGDLEDDGSDLGTVFDGPVKRCYDAGIAVCSAAGNGGLDGQPTEYTFPGCVDNVIGCGGLAANSSTEIWSGSSYNYSSEGVLVDVLAPADGMYGCSHYDTKRYDGGWNGTSFASPIVAGMAALYFELNPTKGADDFERDLYASCRTIQRSAVPTTAQLGHGRVDVGNLLKVSAPGATQVKLKANWSSANCYLWNSVTGAQASAWPGATMTKSGNLFTYTVPAGYDSLVFSSGSNQTVDIAVSSFGSGKTYDLSLATTELNPARYVGSYVS